MAATRPRLQVLVADPDPASAQALKDQLAGDGLRVSMVADPGRVLEELRAAPAHLVLLDVDPPESGFERLRGVRAFDSDVCVVAMTAHPTVETAVEAMRNQAFEYLAKPVDPDALRSTLLRAVEQKGLLMDLEQRLNAEVGRRVRARRTERRLTLKQVARRTQLSISLISQVELGKSAASLSTLYKLSRALHVPVTYFLETV